MKWWHGLIVGLSLPVMILLTALVNSWIVPNPDYTGAAIAGITFWIIACVCTLLPAIDEDIRR